MSLWGKAQQLPTESLQQIRNIYGEHFPIEVRHFLAQWIEDNMWSDVEPENPAHDHYVTTKISNLIQELELKANSLNSEEMFLTKIKLMEAAKMFKQRYSTNPMNLYRYVQQCLATEMRFVQGAGTAITQSTVSAELLQQMEALMRRAHESNDELRRIEQEQESFALSYHECTKINASLQHQAAQQQPQKELIDKLKRQKDNLEIMLNQKVAHLIQARLALYDKLKETIESLTIIQGRVLDDELIRWKRDQQLAGNGAGLNANLETIQEWCERLADLIWMTRQQVKEAERLKTKLPLEPHGVTDLLPSLSAQITQLLSTLVTSTFVIEKQPPQVMKTNTRFTSTVRLLVGGQLNVHMTPPQVKVTIISENQANAQLKNDKMVSGKQSGEASGEILNNTGAMEYQATTRQLSVSFRNMQLKRIKRAEKKGTESVMDEKFSLLFQSQFNVGGGELVFQVWTLSLPVVVIVHGNQEPHAWATVTWDNAFAAPGRVPFVVPDKVPWGQVAEALNVKFRSATGRSLTDDNLRFLSEKAFRTTWPISTSDISQTLLSWAQFCKEPLSDRNFTFWEWFYAVLKLTREHLRGPWVDGHVLGFVRKRQAEEMLSQCPSGTFLLRFSDSELGGVTVAWVGDSPEVFMLQPFTSKDFGIRSLADRISDMQHLVYLYPEIAKDQAFSKYYTPYQGTHGNGYVKPFLRTHVPGWEAPSGTGGSSYAGTPHHQSASYMHSPDPSRETASVLSSYTNAPTPHMSNSNMTGGAAEMDYDISQQLDGFEECPFDLQNLACFADYANPLFPAVQNGAQAKPN